MDKNLSENTSTKPKPKGFLEGVLEAAQITPPESIGKVEPQTTITMPKPSIEEDSIAKILSYKRLKNHTKLSKNEFNYAKYTQVYSDTIYRLQGRIARSFPVVILDLRDENYPELFETDGIDIEPYRLDGVLRFYIENKYYDKLDEPVTPEPIQKVPLSTLLRGKGISINPNYLKYLKYKAKYLKLKNN